MPAETTETSSAVPYPLLMSIQQGTMEYRYRCIPTLKNPFDIAIYPLLLEEARPRTLIEIGSHKGGSALWFADMSANLGFAMHVYSVDLAKVTAVSHPSVTFLEGDARKLADTFADQFLADLPRPWLVIEDADHHYQTTLEYCDSSTIGWWRVNTSSSRMASFPTCWWRTIMRVVQLEPLTNSFEHPMADTQLTGAIATISDAT
jgi:hypothetical protein